MRGRPSPLLPRATPCTPNSARRKGRKTDRRHSAALTPTHLSAKLGVELMELAPELLAVLGILSGPSSSTV